MKNKEPYYYCWEGNTIKKMDATGRELLHSDLEIKPKFENGSPLARVHQRILDKRKAYGRKAH